MLTRSDIFGSHIPDSYPSYSSDPHFDDGEYSEGKTNRDAWILTLATDLEVGPKVRPICLSQDVDAEPGADGECGRSLVSPEYERKYFESFDLIPTGKFQTNEAHAGCV